MENCQWCGSPTDGTFVVVIGQCKFIVCEDCLNLYGNRNYDKLTEKINKHLPDEKQVKETDETLGKNKQVG
jgi:ribosome-binding protein aMBF1 (putative translation factor)